jgi:hypothetical protein
MNCKYVKTGYQGKYFDLKERGEMKNMQTARHHQNDQMVQVCFEVGNAIQDMHTTFWWC